MWSVSAAVASGRAKDCEAQLQPEAARIEHAKAAAERDPWHTAENFNRLKIEPEDARIEIAKNIAAQDGRTISINIENFRIRSEVGRIEVAQIAAAQNGRSTVIYLNKFNIRSPAALLNILHIASLDYSSWQDVQAEDAQRQLSTFENACRTLSAQNCIIVKLMALILRQQHGQLNPNGILTTEQLKQEVTSLMQSLGVSVARVEALLWSKVQRQDVIVGLLHQVIKILIRAVGRSELGSEPMNNEPAHIASVLAHDLAGIRAQDSIEFWIEITGFQSTGEESSLQALQRVGKASISTLGEIMVLGLELSQIVGEPFAEGLSFPTARILEKHGSHLNELLTLYRDRLALERTIGTERQMLLYGALHAPSANAGVELLRHAVAQGVQDLFSQPASTFSYSDIENLRDHWGDVSPVFTLLARFRGRSSWNNEIPVLARLLKSVIEGDFFNYKFSGDSAQTEEAENDRALTQQQIGFLSDSARAAWTTPIARLDRWVGESTSTSDQDNDVALVVKNMIKHLNEVLVEAHGLHDVSQVDAIINEIRTAKTSPLQLLFRLKHSYSLVAIIRATAASLSRLQSGAEELVPLARFTQALGAEVSGSLGAQIKNDGVKLVEKLKQFQQSNRQPEALIFTTTFNDPKLLLMMGDLVNLSSCQNYRNGNHIETLLAYAIDANVIGLASWVLNSNSFENPKHYHEVQNRLKQGQVPVLNFMAAQRRLSIGFNDAVVFATKPLSYAHLRHVVKLGQVVGTGEPGIFLEEAYYQIHDAAPIMNGAAQSLSGDLARSMGAVLVGGGAYDGGQPGVRLMISQSRNPGGVYSDNSIVHDSGGVKTQPYAVW